MQVRALQRHSWAPRIAPTAARSLTQAPHRFFSSVAPSEVVVTAPTYFSDRAKGMLNRIGNVDGRLFTSRKELQQALAKCVVLCVRVETTVDADLINAAPNLKVVCSGTTGINHIDQGILEKRGIPLFHLHGEHTRPTAEHAMTLLLAVARNINAANRALAAGEWDRHRFVGKEMFGLRLGIIGLGKIGSEVCKLATAFGMHVQAYDPLLSEEEVRAKGAEQVNDLHMLLETSDAITLHCPLTGGAHATRGMLGKAELAKLPDGAYLINAARAGIVDEHALVAEVKTGRISAGVDVFDPEPPVQDHILLDCARDHPNLILTPHLGASTWQAIERSSCKLASDALQHLGISDA